MQIIKKIKGNLGIKIKYAFQIIKYYCTVTVRFL